jgi:integrase
MEESFVLTCPAHPWNKGKPLGQKALIKVSEVWAIRVHLQLTDRARDLALLDLAIDSKLRSCDLVGLRVRDVFHGDHVAPRAVVMQRKTRCPVQFEITDLTRRAVANWAARVRLRPDDFLFPSRCRRSEHITTRQYARIVKSWIGQIGLDAAAYGTHSLRRTKASLSYRRTKNLRAVQLLLGHTKLESTVRYLGIGVDDALELAEQTEVQAAKAGCGHPMARPSGASRKADGPRRFRR